MKNQIATLLLALGICASASGQNQPKIEASNLAKAGACYNRGLAFGGAAAALGVTGGIYLGRYHGTGQINTDMRFFGGVSIGAGAVCLGFSIVNYVRGNNYLIKAGNSNGGGLSYDVGLGNAAITYRF